MYMKKPVLPVLFFTLMLDMIGFGMIIPILPIILTDPTSPSFLLTGFGTDAQYFFSGLLTALYGITLFLAAPMLGELSDIYGRKRLLTVGVAILALSQMLFGIGVLIISLPLVIFSRIIAGLAGANFSIAQASIADITEPKDRAKNFGLIGAAFGIGFILGPIISGLVASYTGQASAPFFVAGILGIINTLIVIFFLPETHKERKVVVYSFTLTKGIRNILIAFKDKDAQPLFVSSFLYQSGFTFFTSFIGILLASKFNFNEPSIGVFFGIVGVWIVITQVIILRFVSGRFSERKIITSALSTMGLGIVLYAFVPSTALVYTLVPLIAIGNGLSMATFGALISKSVSKERQGAILGINGSISSLSQGVSPLIAGLVGSFLTIQAPFIAGALLVGFGLYVFRSKN